MGSFSLLQLPLRNASSILIPFLSLFSFVLPNYVKSFLPFLKVYVLLPAFSCCSVCGVLHVDGFFDGFVGEGERDVLLLRHIALPLRQVIFKGYISKCN